MILDLFCTVLFVAGTCGLMWLADRWTERENKDAMLGELQRVARFRSPKR
jgi:hypothetical protein